MFGFCFKKNVTQPLYAKGHFYLTSKLMPVILGTPGRPRVVNLTSVAHEWGHVDFDNINSDGIFGYLGAGWLTYGRVMDPTHHSPPPHSA